MNLQSLNKLLLTMILLCVFSTAESAIIFEDSFDNRADWASETEYSTTSAWPGTTITIIDGPSDPVTTPPGYYSWRGSNASNTFGLPLFVIDDTNPYKGSGKNLNVNMETSSYMNGGGIDISLCNSGTCGVDTISIRFFLYLDPNYNLPSYFWKLFRIYTGSDVQNDTQAPSSTYASQEDAELLPRHLKRSMAAYSDLWAINNGDNIGLHKVYTAGRYLPISGDPECTLSNTISTNCYKEFGIDELTGGNGYDWDFNFKDHRGEWIYYESIWHLNTVGQSDGWMKEWVIPVADLATQYNPNAPTFEATSFELRWLPDRHWNMLIFMGNMSTEVTPHVEYHIAVDDLVIADEIIGPYYEVTPRVGPIRSAGSPTGEQSSGTTSVTLTVTTDVTATCTYGADGVTGGTYPLANTMTAVGNVHSAIISGLSDGNSYSRNILCSDGTDDNDTDYVISWSVASQVQAMHRFSGITGGTGYTIH